VSDGIVSSTYYPELKKVEYPCPTLYNKRRATTA
jgi:hypothetical protein